MSILKVKDSNGNFIGIPAIKGDQGVAGPANTLSVGTVQSGTAASATITGNAPNQTLNLTLPIGPKGDTGVKGDTGAAGPSNILSIGTVAKGDVANATITGTSPSQVLNLVLPKGDKGDIGLKGDIGPQGETGVVVSPNTPTNNNVDVWIDTSDTSPIIVPNGGTTGQVLAKASNNDYDTAWVNQTGGSGGTSNYTDLTNKPKINNVELVGNKTLTDIGVASETHTHTKSQITNFPTNVSSFTNDSNYVTSSSVTSMWYGTQVQYDAITTKDVNTLYFISG